MALSGAILAWCKTGWTGTEADLDAMMTDEIHELETIGDSYPGLVPELVRLVLAWTDYVRSAKPTLH